MKKKTNQEQPSPAEIAALVRERWPHATLAGVTVQRKSRSGGPRVDDRLGSDGEHTLILTEEDAPTV